MAGLRVCKQKCQAGIPRRSQRILRVEEFSSVNAVTNGTSFLTQCQIQFPEVEADR